MRQLLIAPALQPGAENKAFKQCSRCGSLLAWEAKFCCPHGDIKSVLVMFTPQREV